MSKQEAQKSNLIFTIKEGYLVEQCKTCGNKRKRLLDKTKPFYHQHDFTPCCR